MDARPRRLLAFAAGALLMSGCPTDPEPELPDTLAWAVDEPGPYNVGYTTWEITYAPPSTGEDRTILINLWYPTEDSSGVAAVYEHLFTDEESLVDAAAVAPVHAAGYPVFAYSHGNQGFGGSSAFLSRRAASHGWVVVAPDHTGNTLSTHTDPRPLSLWIDRADDLSAALDAIEGDVPALAGPADTRRVVVSGHSFGGYTVWAATGAEFHLENIQAQCDDGNFVDGTCTQQAFDAFEAGGWDDRWAGGIPMAGTGRESWFGPDGLNAVTVPMMQMSGTADSGAVEGAWERTEGVDISWVEIEGGCHQLFALGACGEVPSQEGFDMINAYAFAFARHLTLDDTGDRTLGILDGSISVDDRATLHLR